MIPDSLSHRVKHWKKDTTSISVLTPSGAQHWFHTEDFRLVFSLDVRIKAGRVFLV